MKTTEIIESNLGIYRWCKYTGEFVNKDNALNAIETIQDYEGWGRCRKIIDPNSEEYKCAVDFLKSYGHKHIEIRDILSKVQSSTLTSFYTPTDVAKTITEYALQAYNKLNGRPAQTLLDPSCGTGAFLTGLEWNDTLVEVECCEKDDITRTILDTRLKAMNKVARFYNRKVYFHTPSITSFEVMQNCSYDIITSNIPFGDVSVYDKALDKMGGVYKASQKKIHNYYFMKSLHLLNDGGIMAFITSRWFLSSEKNKPFREEMLKHGTILNIIRLPDNLFPTVEVGSDLIVYYKGHIKDNEVMEYLFFGGWAEDEEDAFHLSCEIKTKKNQYGKNVIHYKYTGTDMANSLSRLLRIGLSCHLNSSTTLTTAQGSGRATIKVAEDHFTDSGKMLHYGSRFFFFFDKFENEE